ncbi:MAG: hypothetical protein KBD07_00880 [Candidatus Omnitrophica bacterium]|jgi:ribosomal protein L37E|nr:hypothetical protein [Candidatus Omnitrophota bacterium]
MFTVIEITCPHCSEKFEESITPYDELTELPCQKCGQTIVKGKKDHCVICAFGSSVCPNLQCRRDCCGG